MFMRKAKQIGKNFSFNVSQKTMQVRSQINGITNLYVMTPGHLNLLDASTQLLYVSRINPNDLKNNLMFETRCDTFYIITSISYSMSNLTISYMQGYPNYSL